MTKHGQDRLAVAALVVAGTVWGAGFMLGKIALAELGVCQIVLYRFVLAAVALLPIPLFRREWPRPADLPLFLLTGFLAVPVTFLLQFGGLALTSASVAALIMGGFPPLLAFAGWWFYRERLTLPGWIAVAGSTIGVFLVVGRPEVGGQWLGDGLLFLSLFAVAAWVLMAKRLLICYSALGATAYIIAFGTLWLLPIALVWEGPPRLNLSLGVWAAVLALGFGCTMLTNALWNWGISRVPAARAGVYVNLEPLVGAVLGVAILQEALGPASVLGGVLIVGAGVVVSRQDVAG